MMRKELQTPSSFTGISRLPQNMARNKKRTQLSPVICPRLICVVLDVEDAT